MKTIAVHYWALYVCVCVVFLLTFEFLIQPFQQENPHELERHEI